MTVRKIAALTIPFILLVAPLASCLKGDETPPVISEVSASSMTETSAVITWGTNEPATSQVEYGLTTSYGYVSNLDDLVSSHSVGLSGLSAGTTYHYRVKSKDVANNEGVSGDHIFTTAQEVITVMTYNVLNGSGAGPTDPNGPWCCAGRGCCGAEGGNRLPLLLEIMKAADADILGVQEAYLWQQDNDAIAQQVAHELDMNYYIGASGIPDGGHVVLFTKFQIIEAHNYPDHFTSPVIRGGLHAVLMTDGGNTLHIFVVHLRPDSTSEDETSFLAQVAEPYLNDLTIIMGDMNFSETSSQATRLRESGWRLPVATGVDHIWVSPKLAPYVGRGPSLNHFNLAVASDHRPVVAEISIYPP